MTKSLLGQALTKSLKGLIIAAIKIMGIASAFTLKMLGTILLKVSEALERLVTK